MNQKRQVREVVEAIVRSLKRDAQRRRIYLATPEAHCTLSSEEWYRSVLDCQAQEAVADLLPNRIKTITEELNGHE